MVRFPTSPSGNSHSAASATPANIIRWAREEGLTIRQIYQRFAAARGQRTLIGSPSDIADNMEEWFRGYGVDGFLFHPSHLPGGLDDFVALVIPELQSRGLFRAEYEGTTLRENRGSNGQRVAMSHIDRIRPHPSKALPPSGCAAVLSHVEHKPLLIFSRTCGGAAP
jgi:hypothetical protein